MSLLPQGRGERQLRHSILWTLEMTDACFLSPPAGADREALEAHLDMLRGMNTDDPLVKLAIEDTEHLLSALPSV